MKLSQCINFSGQTFSVAPAVLRHFGAKEGIFLCRIIWWQIDADTWIEKDIETIQFETGLTAAEQRTVRTNLIQAGVLEEEYKRLEHKLRFRIIASALEMEIDQEPSSKEATYKIPQVKNVDLGTSRTFTSSSKKKLVQVNKSTPLPPRGRSKGLEAFSAEAIEIYAAYPRKIGGPAALRAIERLFPDHLPSALLESTLLFAELWEGSDLQFCPHPTTWFNQHRFLEPFGNQGPRKQTNSYSPKHSGPTQVIEGKDMFSHE